MTTNGKTTPTRSAFFILVLFIAIVCISGGSAAAQTTETPSSARVSFGIGALGSYGSITNSDEQNGPGEVDYGWASGFGLVFEPMFTRNFGFHTGFWYVYSQFKFKPPDDASGVDVSAISHNLYMPVYFLYSLEFGAFSLGFLAGPSLMYMARVNYKIEATGMSYNGDVTKWLNYTQVGAGAGLEFKFRAGRFVDIFIALTGEYYLTSFSDGRYEKQNDHIYWANARTGVLMRAF